LRVKVIGAKEVHGKAVDAEWLVRIRSPDGTEHRTVSARKTSEGGTEWNSTLFFEVPAERPKRLVAELIAVRRQQGEERRVGFVTIDYSHMIADSRVVEQWFPLFRGGSTTGGSIKLLLDFESEARDIVSHLTEGAQHKVRESLVIQPTEVAPQQHHQQQQRESLEVQPVIVEDRNAKRSRSSSLGGGGGQIAPLSNECFKGYASPQVTSEGRRPVAPDCNNLKVKGGGGNDVITFSEGTWDEFPLTRPLSSRGLSDVTVHMQGSDMWDSDRDEGASISPATARGLSTLRRTSSIKSGNVTALKDNVLLIRSKGADSSLLVSSHNNDSIGQMMDQLHSGLEEEEKEEKVSHDTSGETSRRVDGQSESGSHDDDRPPVAKNRHEEDEDDEKTDAKSETSHHQDWSHHSWERQDRPGHERVRPSSSSSSLFLPNKSSRIAASACSYVAPKLRKKQGPVMFRPSPLPVTAWAG